MSQLLLDERVISSVLQMLFKSHTNFILVIRIVMILVVFASYFKFTAFYNVDGIGAFTFSEHYLIFDILLRFQNKIN